MKDKNWRKWRATIKLQHYKFGKLVERCCLYSFPVCICLLMASLVSSAEWERHWWIILRVSMLQTAFYELINVAVWTSNVYYDNLKNQELTIGRQCYSWTDHDPCNKFLVSTSMAPYIKMSCTNKMQLHANIFLGIFVQLRILFIGCHSLLTCTNIMDLIKDSKIHQSASKHCSLKSSNLQITKSSFEDSIFQLDVNISTLGSLQE